MLGFEWWNYLCYRDGRWVVAKRPNEATNMFARYLWHTGRFTEYLTGNKPSFNKTFHLELTGEIQSLEWLQRISGHEIQGHRCKLGPSFVGKIILLDYWHIWFIINWEMFQKSNVFSDFWIEWLLKKQISPQICTEVINLVKLLYFLNKIS